MARLPAETAAQKVSGCLRRCLWYRTPDHLKIKGASRLSVNTSRENTCIPKMRILYFLTVDFKRPQTEAGAVNNFLRQVTIGLGMLALLSQAVNALWLQTSKTNGDITSFAVSGGAVFAGSDSGDSIIRSTNNGTSWTAVGFPNGVNALAAGNGNIFGGAWGSGVYLSTIANFFSSWVDYTVTLTPDQPCFDYVKSLAVIGDNIVVGSWGNIYIGRVSADSVTNWTSANFSNTSNSIFSSFAVIGGNIFAGAFTTPDGGVYLSTDTGTTWTEVGSPYDNSWDVRALAVIGGNLFAGSLGVFLSADTGTSWKAVDSGLANDTINCLVVSGGNLFAGTNGSGVFLSTNNGARWTAVDSGLTVSNVNSLAVSSNNLFAGTQGAGVWCRPLSEMISGVINDEPHRVMLNQENLMVYSPRHGNPDVTIEFSLPRAGRARVTVYNLYGHEIASLVNKSLGQGRYSTTWDTRNAAAGCYTVRLQEGSNACVKSVPIFR